MALTTGARLGPYEVASQIGEGGMGVVYRAVDTNLKRAVALKVLPAAVAADAERLARFQREAEVLAALNHPNIAAIYGLERSGDTTALVMELVEGEDVSQRIARGALPIDEALPIAKQIAGALEAAHQLGIIHRDLKPANIKVRSDGTVKVLDFGLAKFAERLESDGSSRRQAAAVASTLQTITTPAMTMHGIILGTAAYMSPEQARGKPVDARADIWAFGCVLYEMLTGRRCFEHADSVSDAIAAILTRDPDWLALPSETPEPIRRLLRRCLNKNAAARLHHLADARLEIEEALASPIASPAIRESPARARHVGAVPWIIVAALAVAVVGLGLRLQTGERGPVEQPMAQFEMNLPAGVELYQGSSQVVAFSPDGTQVAFVGNLNGLKHVYVRDLGRLDAVAIRGSENALSCFFSPAGDAVGFISDRGLLKVSLRDGTVTSLTPDAAYIGGGAWGSDGRVTFTRSNGLWQVPADGGTPAQVTTLAAGESMHAWPATMNDGKTILFTSVPTEGVQRARVEAVSIATGKRQVIIEGARFPRYTTSGHLVFYRDGGLHAVPFDADRLTATGSPSEMTASVEQDASGAPLAEVSGAGALAYQRAGAVSWRLVWVSRQGVEQLVTDAPRAYLSPHLSSDSHRIVVSIGSDLWVQDTQRSTFTRLTSQQSETASFPNWTPDTKQIVFRTPTGLRSIDTDGSGRSRAIAGTTSLDFPTSVSPDGGTLAFARNIPGSSADVYVLSLAGDPAPRPLVTGPAFDGGPQFSPDGRWLAYVSNDSGRFQVYLRRYPGPDSRWPVSTDGGTSPLWSHSGNELFYRNGDKMMAVSVSATPRVTLTPPRVIFEQRYAYGNSVTATNYDVSADGERFLMVKGESGVAYLNVVLNWLTKLGGLPPSERK